MFTANSECSVRRRRLGRSGIAALEFAILAPVLLLMILGMLAFGFYFMFIHAVDELTSSAARASVGGLSPGERNQLAQNFVANALLMSSLLKSADLTVTTATTGTPSTLYQVTLVYALKDTPIPTLASLASIQVSNITRTSTIVFGGY